MYIAVKNEFISGTGIGKLDPEWTTPHAQALIILECIQKYAMGKL